MTFNLAQSCYFGCMRVKSDKEKYLNEVFGLADADLAAVRTRMSAAQKEQISISSAEARMLQFLIRGFGVKKIVEFGTLFGYSALAMAKVLPEDGVIFTLEKEEAHHRFAAETFNSSPDGKKIVSLCGDGVELMREIEGKGPFDLVFIDANKGGYVEYLNWAEKNLRRGGLIVGDNSFLWGGVWEAAGAARSPKGQASDSQIAVMKEFNQRLSDPAKYNSTLLPTDEGLTVAQKL
jgi:predicted O-methyltransferase YrrM